MISKTPGFRDLKMKNRKVLSRNIRLKVDFVAMLGELVGTALFMIFALGGTNVANANSPSGDTNNSQLLYISLSFGFSLAVNVWIFYRISGGLFNPAISLGLAIAGAITPLRAALLSISQILGGIIGAAIIEALLPGSLNVATGLGGGASITQGLFIEMFLTAELMLTIFMLAAEKHKATFLAPLVIGLSLFIAELVGVYYTGGSLNPARSFGPAVVARSFKGYHWIYWVGPYLGAILAAGFYKMLKVLEYETVMPGQDGDETGSNASKVSQVIKDRNQLVTENEV
ncbi:Aquaporin-1 [Neolecta irregularis DAH-3]|uniref:Aquaporin-1 n=1 Tax=Neolecta irregularis (strain DAH-3) TaxID=1198029 RepID=A0A1U7LHY7_NEOID|nr:Aquaporin-1 [Neolecta irregularis DAH-3]|eukprot:OLL22259.1 Aquaporin-1 [Neolecta irregularis DAH-3]